MSGLLDRHIRVTGMTVLAAVLGGILCGCAPSVQELREQAIDQYRNRQHIESMATLREILEIRREDPQANYYMGLNYRMIAARKFRDGDIPSARRELDTSILYFTDALKSWPNYMAAADAKNEAFEARGKYDEALAVSQRVAYNNRGVADHFLVLGNEYRERGDYDNALRYYKIALSTAPDMDQTYAAMGQLYLRTGNRALAMDSLRRAHELNPSDGKVSQYLASLDATYEAHPASHMPAQVPAPALQP